VAEATDAFDRYRLNDAVGAVYRFIWNDLADWYVEAIKPRLYGDQPGGDVARAVAAEVFDVALRLLHPAMPYITETLWKRFPGRADDASISVAAWPRPEAGRADAEAVATFGALQDLVGAARSIRAEYGVQPGQTVRASISAPGPLTRAALEHLGSTVRRLARVSELADAGTEATGDATGAAHAVLPDGATLAIPLGDLVDVERECARLRDEEGRLDTLLGAQEKKLANEQFVARAPADVVQREREKLGAWREQLSALRQKRDHLGCGAA
jgi:valyl-tRNA synthetase